MSQTIFTDNTTTAYTKTPSPIEEAAKKCPTDYKVAFWFAVIVIPLALILFLWWRWYSQKEDMKEGLLNWWFSVDGDDENNPELKAQKEDTADCVVDKISVSDYLKTNQKFFDAMGSCAPADAANIRNAMRRRRM